MFKSFDQIRECLNNNFIYGATCLQATTSTLLQCVKFDYCIIDEASQITEPLAIGPIMTAQRFVMIGDYY